MVRINRNISRSNEIPPALITNLTWNTRTNIQNAGSPNANLAYLITDPRNVDVPNGGTAINIPGYTAMQVLYRQMRVIKATIRLLCANREAFPVLANLTPVNEAVTINDPAFDVYLDQPRVQKRYLGPLTGNGTGSIYQTNKTSTFAGAPEVDAVDFYVGQTDLTGPRPTNNWYYCVGVSNNGTNLSSGVDVDVNITWTIRFFEKNTPTN